MSLDPDIELAQREMWRCATDDPTYAELMGTYATLGVLLDKGGQDADFDADCGDLMDRVTALGRRVDTEFAQQCAAAYARHGLSVRAA